MANRILIELLPSGDQQWFSCDSCGTNTNHIARTGVQEREIDERGKLKTWQKYWTIQCDGCKGISFYVEMYSTEVTETDEHGNIIYPPIRTVLYPHRLAGRKMLPDSGIPAPIFATYAETYKALSMELAVIAGMGMRAVLEMVCRDQGLVNGSLKDKIDGLASRGIIGAHPAQVLHDLRFLGNMAAHEASAHTMDELIAALEMIEHLLHSLYESNSDTTTRAITPGLFDDHARIGTNYRNRRTRHRRQ